MNHLLARVAKLLFAMTGCCVTLWSAPADRITLPVNASQSRVVRGNLHRFAQPQFDQGPVDASTPFDFVTLMFRPSAAQQAELDQLLADQQNPSSPSFHRWLTPEEFGNRFGLTPADHSKVVEWLTREGFTVKDSARGRNWVAFGGS